MTFKTAEELLGIKSRKEIERITFLLDKYSKDCNISFNMAMAYLMADCGYRKLNYIPCNKEDLFIITQLSNTYMRIYAKSAESFTQLVMNCYDYCKRNGYSKECSQTVLKLG